MKQFLDASGLNLYTQALINGTLVVGRSQDSSFADDASTAFYASHASATGLIGTIPLENLPEGALDRLVQVANKEARLALTSSQVQLGDTVQELDTKQMYIVVDEAKLGTEDAFVQYTAGRASFAQDASHADKATVADDASWADEARKVAWANVTDKDSSYNPAPHTHVWADITNAPSTWDASAVTMGGYQKTSGDVGTSDSALVAIGKVEKKADDALAAAQAHTQDSSTIVSMGEYVIANSYSPVSQSDSLDTAIGKIERLAIDSSVWDGIGGKPTEFKPELHTQDASTITAMTGYSVAGSYTSVAATDSLETAIGKVEKKALDSSNTADWDSITNVPSEFTPTDHDAAKVTSINGYSTSGVSGNVASTDDLATALAKIEVKADSGADEPIPDATINSIIAGTF